MLALLDGVALNSRYWLLDERSNLFENEKPFWLLMVGTTLLPTVPIIWKGERVILF